MTPFEEAADGIDRLARGEGGVSPSGEAILSELGLNGWAAADARGPALPRRAALLRAAGRMSRIFRLPAPDAPGLAFVGGTAVPAAYGLDGAAFRPADVSGRGADTESAFLGCVGEAVEHLSRLAWGDEPIARCGAEWLGDHGPGTAAALAARLGEAAGGADILPAVRLGDGEPVRVPADLCLDRGRPGVPPPPSGGCAAGETRDAACLSGLLELIERDAAALWWCGGRPARPLAAETLVAALGTLLPALRRGRTGRPTWLLDIATDLEVPAVAAVSTEPDGTGLACGLAARTSPAGAARAAVLELGQMELANRLVAMKLERGGEGALAPVERRHARRMALRADLSAILAVAGVPRPHREGDPADPSDSLAALSGRLARQGIDALAVDLTRPALGIPAVRILAPALQPLPAAFATDRLVAARVRHRDRADCLHDIDLI